MSDAEQQPIIIKRKKASHGSHHGGSETVHDSHKGHHTQCHKGLLNGPCGGSEDGHCEIDPDVPCAWQLIYDRLSSMNKLHVLLDLQPPKNWSTSRDGGPRKIVRQDLRLIEDEE